MRIYLEPDEIARKIPTYRMLSMSMDELRSKGGRLLHRLKKVPGPFLCSVSGGRPRLAAAACPPKMLPTWAVAMEHESVTVDQMESRLRSPLPHPGDRTHLQGSSAAGYAHRTGRVFWLYRPVSAGGHRGRPVKAPGRNHNEQYHHRHRWSCGSRQNLPDRALTGIETDRLREEKKRGITIELGLPIWTCPTAGERASSMVARP